MEQFFLQYETTITVLGKILGVMFGGILFVRFIYSFSLKYFWGLDKRISGVEDYIWGPNGEPDKGGEHRLTVLERDHKNRVENGRSCRTRKK